MNLEIPKFRAQIKGSKNFLCGNFIENADGYFIDNTEIEINTLSIFLPEILDCNGNQLFAAFNESGLGGDTIEFTIKIFKDSLEEDWMKQDGFNIEWKENNEDMQFKQFKVQTTLKLIDGKITFDYLHDECHRERVLVHSVKKIGLNNKENFNIIKEVK